MSVRWATDGSTSTVIAIFHCLPCFVIVLVAVIDVVRYWCRIVHRMLLRQMHISTGSGPLNRSLACKQLCKCNCFIHWHWRTCSRTNMHGVWWHCCRSIANEQSGMVLGWANRYKMHFCYFDRMQFDSIHLRLILLAFIVFPPVGVCLLRLAIYSEYSTWRT